MESSIRGDIREVAQREKFPFGLVTQFRFRSCAADFEICEGIRGNTLKERLQKLNLGVVGVRCRRWGHDEIFRPLEDDFSGIRFDPPFDVVRVKTDVVVIAPARNSIMGDFLMLDPLVNNPDAFVQACGDVRDPPC